MAILDELGCDRAQGYVFASPQPVADLPVTIRGSREPEPGLRIVGLLDRHLPGRSMPLLMSKRIGFGLIVAVRHCDDVAAPAAACGGLVGENGTIRLSRTTTLAAYHDGVERYVTSFEFTGQGEEVGSIVPLPGIPSKVKRGGDWTLQRLEREVAPPERVRVRRRGQGRVERRAAQR